MIGRLDPIPGKQLSMDPALLKLLRCPECRSALSEACDPVEGQGIGLACLGCGRHFGVARGIPRFVPNDGYASTFSFEWDVHRRTQLDRGPGGESEQTFLLKTGWTLPCLAGKWVLDAGVGAGRFAAVALDARAHVVGLDISYAVDSAAENLSGRGGFQGVQGDILNPPFAAGSFDYIYSMGVLHHTPDCKRAFMSLLPLLKEGGEIAVWVYEKRASLIVSDVYRLVTRNLPSRLLYFLCHIAIPLGWFHRVPLVGRFLLYLFPHSRHPDPRWRILDTFDWYSPRYQSKHTQDELLGWFAEAGLEDVVPTGYPVGARGRKRVATASSK